MLSNNPDRSPDRLLHEIEKLNSRLASAVAELNALKSGESNPEPITGIKAGHILTMNRSSNETFIESEIRYSSVYNSMSDGMAIHEIVYNKSGVAADYIITDVNPAFVRITGIDGSKILGKRSTEAYSLPEAPYLEIYAMVASSGTPASFETFFPPLNRYFQISVFSHAKGKFATIFQDVSERKLISDTQNFLLSNSYSGSGEDFFESLAKFLARILNMDYVCIDKLEGDNLTARTLAIYNDGKFDSNITYSLKETPCGDVVGKSICCFPRDVCQLFPNDPALAELLAEGYIGSTLWSFTGKPIGLIAVIGRKPIENPQTAEIILKLVAIRAAGELERKNAQEVIVESEERFRTIAETVPVLVCVTRTEDSVVLFTNEVNNKAFGYYGEEIVGTIGPDYYCEPSDRVRLFEKLKKDGLVNNFQLKVKRRDGTPFWIMTSVQPIIYHGQHAVIGASIDITDLKNTESDLHESEEKFLKLFNMNPLPMALSTVDDGIFQNVNESFIRDSGLTLNEIIGRTSRDLNLFVHHDLRERIIDNILNKGHVAALPCDFRLKNDQILNCLVSSTFLSIKGTDFLLSTIQDVTEIIKTREALKENQNKLRSVLDATLESIYMFDREGVICMSNSIGIQRLKISDEKEVIGHQYSEYILPELALARQKKLEEVFTTGKPLEYEDERDCKIYHHSYYPVFKDNKVVNVVTYSIDITARKRAESKLMESEDRFRTIAESLTVMISIVRICDSALTFTNEPFEKTFGFGMDGTAEKKYPDSFYDPDDFKNIRDILRGGGIINNKEVLVRNADGSNIWIMLSLRKINFLNEPSYISIAIDISETKRTQLELLRLNRLLNAHSKSSHTMMHSDNEMDYINEVCRIIIDDCGHSMVWVGYAQNDSFKRVIPVAHYGFDNGYIDELNISWDDTDRGRGPTGTAIKTGKYALCRNMLTDPAFEPWRKAAIERGYASSLVMPLISDGKPFGAISLYSKDPDPFSEAEINLIKELADDLAYGISVIRLAESERTAAESVIENEAKLKELIATKDKFFNIVAHDLKNPFTSLLGASELLYEHIDQMTPDNVKELALILNDSAKGGYAILQNLLDWSRSETGLLKFNPENLNLRTVIEENVDNLQLQVKNKGINLLSELKEDLLICADRNMINTVLRNLLSNAVKYTYKNGNIAVRVTNTAVEVIITVKDSGIGISREKAETLFRLENSISLPGTEKEQGTGLGLKLCKEIAEKMGGRIWVESEAGQGSEFKFTLPLIGASAQGRSY